MNEHNISKHESVVTAHNVTKRFPGVVANDQINFEVKRGEIHGLLGENGAGKSTLMKILYGLYTVDKGEILLHGEPVSFDSPQDAIAAGIGMVHQHFMLIPRLSVVKNVVLGEREIPTALGDDKGRNRLVNWALELFSLGLETPRSKLTELMSEYGIDINPDRPVWELEVGQRQRVEILKALYRDVDVLILDEPTAVLTPAETREIFQTLRKLVDQGLTIIFITHKLWEATEITDRITVLRDGSRVDTVETDTVTRNKLAEMMVGREVLFDVEKRPATPGETVLEAEDLRVESDRGIEAVSGINLHVDSGEIVGIAGVSGNGQEELAECLTGLREAITGRVTVGGTNLTGRPTREFVSEGVSFIPADRHEYGCAPSLSVKQNAILKKYCESEFQTHGLMDDDAAEAYTEYLIEEFDIRGAPEVNIKTNSLSGGNMQKLIVGRELDADPNVLIAHQPTRGVDIGAVESLQQLLLNQRDKGTGIVLFSEDISEIFDLSDRILVMYEGEVVYETTPAAGEREQVGLKMASGDDASASIVERTE